MHSMESKIRPGYLVRKQSNPYVKYVVVSVKKGFAHLAPANKNEYTLAAEEALLYPNGYPISKLIKLEYSSLLLSQDNMNRVNNYMNMCFEGSIYIPYDNKMVDQIEQRIDECNIVKVYTSEKGGHCRFIYFDDIKHVVTSVHTKHKGWIKMPAYKITFHDLCAI